MSVNDENNEFNYKKEARKRKLKRGLIIALASFLGLSVTTVVAAKELYDSFFDRYERPDYSVSPYLNDYNDVKDHLPRQERYFYSNDDVKLKGYYYKATDAKGLIVFVHGFHSGADDYLPAIAYFVEKGYNVFAYDGTGTFDSEGDSTVGMCQSLVDLDYALKYVESDEELSSFPLFLVGHSCGGYAVSSVLSLAHKVSACACIAAVNNCYTLILDKGKEYAGKIAAEGFPKLFLNKYQELLFKDYVNYSGVKGINESGIPVLIAHGVNDETISFDGPSIIAKKEDIVNPNVEYYVGEGACSGHSSIWHSERAQEYKTKIDSEAKVLVGYEEKVAYYATVDKRLYSEINYDLFDKINDLFESTLNKN